MSQKLMPQKPKSAIFVDGANFHLMSRGLDITVDYRKLLSHFSKSSKIVRAFYYTVLLDDGEFSPIKPLADWLEYNGYTVITKTPSVSGLRDGTVHSGISKSSMNVSITLDAIEMSEFVDHIIILSGDGELSPLVRALQRRGTEVTILGTVHGKSSVTSDELRRKADHFINLAELAEELQRTDNRPLPNYIDMDEELLEEIDKFSQD